MVKVHFENLGNIAKGDVEINNLRDNAENNIRKHYRRFSKNARIAHKTA
jgi:hypothetical protein